MHSLTDNYNKYTIKKQQFNSTKFKIIQQNHSSPIVNNVINIKTKENLKSSSISNTKNISLPLLEIHKFTKIRAFEVLSKLKQIKGLEKLEEKNFLDLILTEYKQNKGSKKNNNNLKDKLQKKIEYNKKKNEEKENDENKVNVKSKTLPPKLMELILNLFSTLFWKLNIKSFQSLKEERKKEKKVDLQHNVLASEKRDHEIAFQMVFKSLIKKELKNQGYICRKEFDIFTGEDCLDALEFLITLLNPSTKTVLNNIYDIHNKNLNEKSSSNNFTNLENIKEKKENVTLNNIIEENVVYNNLIDKENNDISGNNHKPFPKDKNTIVDDLDDILPLTPIPEKRIKKYGQYNDINFTNIHDKENLKKLKKEMEILKNENKKLLNENKKIKQLLKELTSENGNQNIDIKRIAIMKSQIIQLKRQVLSQEKIINDKSSYIDEVNIITNKLSDDISDIEKNNSIDEENKHKLNIIKVSLIKLNEKVDKSKNLNYLEKNFNSIFNNENDSNQVTNDNNNELIFYSDFISSTTRPRGQVSISDICSGKLEHINIKHVGRLETKLHKLYIDLSSIKIYFESFFNPKLNIIYENNIKKSYENAISSLNDTINFLLPLSVLIPSAPYPNVNKVLEPRMPVTPTSDEIIKELELPSCINKSELKKKLNNIIKGFKIYQDLMTEEKNIYKNEFDEYKTNFENICQTVKNEIIAYENKYKAIGNTIIDIKYPINTVYQSLQSLKNNFNTDNLVEYLKVTEKELNKVLHSLNNIYK